MQNNQQAPKGFHRLTIEERLDQIASMTELGQDEIQRLKKFGNPVSYTHLTLPTTPYV